MGQLPRLVIAVLVLVSAALPVSAARWYEDYEQAVALLDSGGCSPDAIALLGAASVDKPKPRLNARTYAQRRIDYLPYYQLARANLACGNLPVARKYLEDARSHGVTPAKLLDTVAHDLAAAEAAEQETQGPAVDPGELAARISQTEERIRRAEAAQRQLDRLWGDETVAAIVGRVPDLARRRQNAEGRLQEARSRLQTGTGDRDLVAIGDAGLLATEAWSALDSLHGELEDRLQAAQRPTELPIRPTARPPSPPSQPTSQPVLPTPMPQAQPTEGVGSQPVEPVQVPTELRLAAEQYLRADYEAVLRTLANISFSASRPRAVALLLRAAARFAVYRISGESDQALHRAVLADIGECRRLDTVVQPDARAFSPRFRELFEQANLIRDPQ